MLIPNVGGWANQLDKLGARRRERLMEKIYDYLTSGKMKPQIDVKTGKTIPLTIEDLKVGAKLHDIPESLLPYIRQIRDSIDEIEHVIKRNA